MDRSNLNEYSSLLANVPVLNLGIKPIATGLRPWPRAQWIPPDKKSKDIQDQDGATVEPTFRDLVLGFQRKLKEQQLMIETQ